MKKIIFSLFFVLIFSCKDQTSIEKKQNYKITDIQKENSLTKGEILRFLENTFKYLKIGVSFESLDYEKIKKLAGNTSDIKDLKKRIDIKNIRNINGIQNTVESFFNTKFDKKNYPDPLFIFFSNFFNMVFTAHNIPNIFKGDLNNSMLFIENLLSTTKFLKEYICGEKKINFKNEIIEENNARVYLNLSNQTLSNNHKPHLDLENQRLSFKTNVFDAFQKAKEVGIPEDEILDFMTLHTAPYLDLFDKSIKFFEFFLEGLKKIQNNQLQINEIKAYLEEKSNEFYLSVNFSKILVKRKQVSSKYAKTDVSKPLIKNKQEQLKQLANKLN